MALSEILTALSLSAIGATLWLLSWNSPKGAGPSGKKTISPKPLLQPALVPQCDNRPHSQVPRHQRTCSR
jgi:hypothetical protein